MTLGTGIFLSTLTISLIYVYAVYIKNKNHNFKKTAIKIASMLTILAILVAGIFFSFKLYINRPVLQTKFLGVKLNSEKSEIKFIKGKPDVEQKKHRSMMSHLSLD